MIFRNCSQSTTLKTFPIVSALGKAAPIHLRQNLLLPVCSSAFKLPNRAKVITMHDDITVDVAIRGLIRPSLTPSIWLLKSKTLSAYRKNRLKIFTPPEFFLHNFLKY